MSEDSEFVGHLVSAILNTEEIEQDNWTEFSLVLDFDEEMVSSTYGYFYDAYGEWASFQSALA